MRILILTQYYWPESFRITALVDALVDAGAEVTVLTGQPNYPDGVVFPGYRAASVRRERYGAHVDVFRVPTVPRARASALRLAANYMGFVLAASVVGPWLLRGRPIDAIVVYAPSPITQVIPGIVLKQIKGARLLTWVQDLWPQTLESTGHVRNPTVLSLLTKCVGWLYRNNDQLLAQSMAFVDAITPLAGATPVTYFPNPGDASFASEAPETAETPALVLPPGFNVVFTGNFGTVQALDTIVEAAELLRNDSDVRFVLVGSGSRSAWLAAEVARRGLTNVMLPGRFDVAAMPGILAQASALLVTLSRGELLSQTIPAKVQGYLAAGRPILASLDGEGASIVTTANAGLSSPAEDAPALADNVRRLRAMTPAERAQLGANAREFYNRHFRPDVLARQLLDELQTLVGAR